MRATLQQILEKREKRGRCHTSASRHLDEENEELISPNSTSRTKDKTTFSEKQSAEGIELMAEDILLIPPSD